MPLLTRIYIKTSFLFLILALLLRVFNVISPLIGVSPGLINSLTAVYVHVFLVGWVTELIFGIAHWMFPKVSRENHYGSSVLTWGTFYLLNAGLILRGIGEPWRVLSGRELAGWLLVVSAVLQWAAGVLFVVNTWQRVKMK
jgi:hypothetical protein